MKQSDASRVAVVTGGAMGIGADSAEQLAKRGYHVVLADINKSAAEEAASRFQRAGLSVSAIEMDVSNSESIAAAFGELDKRHGRCDVLVNGAGIAKLVPFIDYPLDALSRIGVIEPGMIGIMRPVGMAPKRDFEGFQGCVFLPDSAMAISRWRA